MQKSEVRMQKSEPSRLFTSGFLFLIFTSAFLLLHSAFSLLRSAFLPLHSLHFRKHGCRQFLSSGLPFESEIVTRAFDPE